MKRILLFLLTSQFAFAQLPNISFNGSNAWSTNANITFNTALNQATIFGNGNNFVRTSLTANLASPPQEFYLVADVFLSGVVTNIQNIKNPQLVVRDNNDELIGRINLNAGLENQWFKTGIKIENYSSSSIKIEIGVNGTTGTMVVKNPVLTTTAPTFTYDFPFAIPSDVSSLLNVDLSQKHNFQNDLLSTNSHFVYADYQWGSAALNNAINTYFPMSNLRFPGGSVGNHYNYQTDTFYLNTTTPNNLYNIANNGYTFNYNGYKNLVVNSGATATLMFNVLTNTPLQSKAEYQSRVASGLPIKWIELGNEMFFQENQTGNITGVTSYINHAQQVSAELKSVNPNVKLAVCLEKDDYVIGDWNQIISQNQTYFDAGVVHNYNAVGNYFYGKYDAYAMLKGYKVSTNRFNQYHTMFPAKPLLLTEWGITTEVDAPYFLQTLGVADMFLATEKANENGIVAQAGIHMLYKDNENTEATLMYKGTDNQLRLTSRGVVYSKLFQVFKNSEVYNAEVISSEIETGLKGVYGKMVKKGTDYKIFIVNKLPVASPFTLQVNGLNYSGNYTKETLTANMSTPVPEVVALANNWSVSNSSGLINLEPSSISVITIPEANLETAIFENADNKIIVYPNPVMDRFYWNEMGVTLVNIMIYDAFGRQIAEIIPNQNKTIHMSDYSSGIYFVKFICDDTTVLIKKNHKKIRHTLL